MNNSAQQSPDLQAANSPANSAPKTKQGKSLARLWRQLMFSPIFNKLSSIRLSADIKNQLSQKITEAERGHRGEVVLIIENHLPIQMAYNHDCRDRSIDLFAQYRVWDTEENTGVLVYVNLCEHAIEIVADRGINAQVAASVWQEMCDTAIAELKKESFLEGLSGLVSEIGRLLRQYYYLEGDPQGNELSDRVVHLR